MYELFNNALSQVRTILCTLPLQDAVVIDATAGNGKDTLFLAQAVGEEGHVYAFDIQQEAINNTNKLLSEHNITWCTLIKDGHENVDKYVTERPLAVIFNLGYLPGGTTSIITQPQSTLCAVQKALTLLRVGGILALVIYTGHEGGKNEENELKNYFNNLSRNFDVLQMTFLNRSNNPPYMVAVRKLREA